MVISSDGLISWTPDFDYVIHPANSAGAPVTVTVSDGKGGSATQSYTITVSDTNRLPVIDAIGDKSANEGQPLTFTASAIDPDGDPLQYRWDFDNDGTWDTDWSTTPTASNNWHDDWTGSAKLEVGDGNLSATAMAGVTINNLPPTVDAGPDQEVECGLGTLFFEGSFTDPGADTWTATVDYGDGSGKQALPLNTDKTFTLEHTYADCGAYTMTVTVTDDDAGLGSDTADITVVDTTLPVISVSVSPDLLWPANHEMVEITVTVTVSDKGDPNPTVVLTSVESNEPDDAKGNGDGNTVNDIQGADIGSEDYEILLRAERAGSGDGRVYTITYMVTDASGNSTIASATVIVPHDKGK